MQSADRGSAAALPRLRPGDERYDVRMTMSLWPSGITASGTSFACAQGSPTALTRPCPPSGASRVPESPPQHFSPNPAVAPGVELLPGGRRTCDHSSRPPECGTKPAGRATLRPTPRYPVEDHMHPLTLICIVLAAAVLWIAFTWTLLAHLARTERRQGVRAPRKSADGTGRWHGTRTTRRPTVRRVRPPRRVAVHGRIR